MAPTGPLPRLTLAPRSTRRWTPWQSLCFALLRDAVKHHDDRWLDGLPAPLDFPTVCAVLELEPTAVRRALRRR